MSSNASNPGNDGGQKWKQCTQFGQGRKSNLEILAVISGGILVVRVKKGRRGIE